MKGVTLFETRCHLDWWANSAACLAGLEVSLVVGTTEIGWTAHGRLSSAYDEVREGFTFLCDVDLLFTLRFEDESEFTVTVRRGEGDDFTLTEYSGPATRSISYETELP